MKRTRQQDKEGLAKQAAQAEAELRKKSMAAEVKLRFGLSKRELPVASICTVGIIWVVEWRSAALKNPFYI